MADLALPNGKHSVGRKSFIQHSIPLPPHTYEQDEYFCQFKPRIHSDAHLADAGSWQCQVDFLDSSGTARADALRNESQKSYAVGCINPTVGNFTALCASEAIPERLALTTYMVEYAYIHDDVIEYAEKKQQSQLTEKNTELMEGLDLDAEVRAGSKDHVRRRQLQAKMAVELLDMDNEQGKECLRLWKEMSDVFVQIRDLNFKGLDEYLPFRVVDAGCPWTMSLLCFSMDFSLTEAEVKETSAITNAAYDAWVLVNDYFSWDKEWQNYQANGKVGEIVNAVFLFMKWYNIDWKEAKKMLRSEIINREKRYCQEKANFLARGNTTEKTIDWLLLLDLVTAGNFAWSMTTARYNVNADDAYPSLRAAQKQEGIHNPADSLSIPISKRILEGKNISFTQADNNGSSLSTVAQNAHIALTSLGYVANGTSNGTTSEVVGPNDLATPQLHLYESMVLEPHLYIESLPSKGVRNSAIDGLDAWYQVPDKSLAVIQEVTNLLHSSSLMIDDIEDGSQLRRSCPATHTIFGIGQTINSANLLLFKALKAVESLSPAAVSIFTSKVIEGHIGQGMDLYWKQHTQIPTEEEYFTMVDGKTGGLFVLLAELMRSEATRNKDLDLIPFMKLLGRYFQTRDDYMNLEDTEYTRQKGFAEDISEGKISMPLIHALNAKLPSCGRLRNILQLRKTGNGLSPEIRKLALDVIKSTGGLDYAKTVVLALQEMVDKTLTHAEQKTGISNWVLRLVQKRLEI